MHAAISRIWGIHPHLAASGYTTTNKVPILQAVSCAMNSIALPSPHWNTCNCRTRLNIEAEIFLRRYAAIFLSKRVEFFSSPPMY